MAVAIGGGGGARAFLPPSPSSAAAASPSSNQLIGGGANAHALPPSSPRTVVRENPLFELDDDILNGDGEIYSWVSNACVLWEQFCICSTLSCTLSIYLVLS